MRILYTQNRTRLQGANQARQAQITAARAVPIDSEAARRNWLGLKREGCEWVGPDPDPSCGGTNRFSINPREGIFNCRGCGARGNVIALVMHLDKCDFLTAVNTLAGTDIPRTIIKPKVITKPPPDPDVAAREKFERAMNIWRETTALNGTLAEVYLNSRYIYDIAGLEHVLRFHPACDFGRGVRHPAMVALWRDIFTDKRRAIWRVALTADGQAVLLPNGKKLKLSLGSTRGAAIKIDPDSDVHEGLHIAEGPETALAGRQRWNFRPMWAVGDAGHIAKFEPLPGVGALTVLVDHDVTDVGDPGAGQRDAATCRNIWLAAGREFRGFTSSEPGCDIADIIEFEAVGANND
jgi:hypothetical protein